VEGGTEQRTVMVLMSMKQMEQFLPAHLFIRVHRCYIVSLDHITEFTRDMVFVKDQELPIGSQYKGQLEKAVSIFSEESFSQPITAPISYLTQKAYAV